MLVAVSSVSQCRLVVLSTAQGLCWPFYSFSGGFHSIWKCCIFFKWPVQLFCSSCTSSTSMISCVSHNHRHAPAVWILITILNIITLDIFGKNLLLAEVLKEGRRSKIFFIFFSKTPGYFTKKAKSNHKWFMFKINKWRFFFIDFVFSLFLCSPMTIKMDHGKNQLIHMYGFIQLKRNYCCTKYQRHHLKSIWWTCQLCDKSSHAY